MAAGGAPKLPTGKVFVPLLTDDRVSAENLRDLKRTLEGGGVSVVNRQQRFPIGGCCKVRGDVSREACEETFQELASAIDEEMMAEMDPKVLRQLTLRVASHVSVGPGLQAVLAHSLPPALWQPTFTVCVGYGQVRVLTLAYVGQPLAGDRPSCKQSGTVLRILTGNLSQSGGLTAASARYRVFPAAHGAESIEEHLEALEPLLLAACTSGDWAAMEKKNPSGPERSRSVSVSRALQRRLGAAAAPCRRSSVPRRLESAAAAGAGAVARATSVSRALRQVVEGGAAEERLPLAGGRPAPEEGEEAAWERGPQAGARLVKEQLGAGVSLLRGLFAGGQPTGAPPRAAPAGPPRRVMVDRKARMQAAMQAKAGQPAPPPAVASDQGAVVAKANQPAAQAVAFDLSAEEARATQCARPEVRGDRGAEEAEATQPVAPVAAFAQAAGEGEATQTAPPLTHDSGAVEAGAVQQTSAVAASAPGQPVPAAVASDVCAKSDAAQPAPLAALASDEDAADAKSSLPSASAAIASAQGAEKAVAAVGGDSGSEPEPDDEFGCWLDQVAAEDCGSCPTPSCGSCPTLSTATPSAAAQPATLAAVSGDEGAAETAAAEPKVAAAAVAGDRAAAQAVAPEPAPPAAVASCGLAAEAKVTKLSTPVDTNDQCVALPGG